MSKSNVFVVDIVAVSVDATCDLVNVFCTSFCTISPSTATVNVSLPPSLFSVKSIPSPATNLPFKNPAVVSLLDTATLTSVSAAIAVQDEPFHTFNASVVVLKYNAPVANASPSLSTDGAELFAPKYVSSKSS